MANCPFCRKYFRLKSGAIDHINKFHSAELDKSNMDAPQALYFDTHKKLTGTCMCGCGKPTDWNYKTGKPFKLSNDPECRKRVYQKAEENMMAATGHSVHDILNDMEHQKDMQKNRPSYGKYEMSDGGEIEYLSSLEKSWLRFCDVVLEFTSNMITSCPEYFEYYDPTTQRVRKYIPDYYLPDYNLIVEIKDAGNTNPAFVKETKYKVPLKDEVMRKQTKYNYIRINGTKYGTFVETLYKIVRSRQDEAVKGIKTKNLVITESACSWDQDDIVTESAVQQDPSYGVVIYSDPITGRSQLGLYNGHNCIVNDGYGLTECGIEDFALKGSDVTVYKYIGDPDFGEIYRTAEQLSAINDNTIDLLTMLAESSIMVDISGIRNNDHKRNMFVVDGGKR